jgi:hypothetical protein
MKQVRDFNERVYVVNLMNKRAEDCDYIEIPFTRNLDYALKYAKQRHIDKHKIIAMTDETFSILMRNSDESVDYSELFAYKFGKKTYYVTDSEYEFFDSVCGDLCFETNTQLHNLYMNLKYFEGDETCAKIRKAIKSLFKKYGSSHSDVSMKLMDSLDINKAADKVIIKQRGDL